MIFTNKSSATEKSIQPLQINHCILHRTANYTYLGVTLDEQLSFDLHVKKTISKVSAKLLQLRKIRPYITEKAALLVYKNMVLSITEYRDDGG